MTEFISSPSNPRIKAAAKLREARARRDSGLIVIDGARELARALDAGIRIGEVFTCREVLSAEAAPLLERAASAGASIVQTSPTAYGKLAFGERREGVVAVAARPARGLEQLVLSTAPLIGIVEGVEKPGNLGAILRTADAAGLDALIAVDAATDVYGPNAIRASLGAVFTVSVVEADASATLEYLRNCQVRIIAADPDATTSYDAVDYTGPVAIVLGAEAAGLSEVWAGPGVTRVALPMRGKVDSLNVSATAAVLFYEAVRQRGSSRRTAD